MVVGSVQPGTIHYRFGVLPTPAEDAEKTESGWPGSTGSVPGFSSGQIRPGFLGTLVNGWRWNNKGTREGSATDRQSEQRNRSRQRLA